jgi:lysophospholipase L1-like esterase
MKAGDFLLVQFGHNDETHTCPRYVSTADYARELGNMANIARAKGATPIFVTPMGHRAFDAGTVRKTLVEYANAMREAGEQLGVEVVDLNARSFEYYMMVGDSALATKIFDGGTTHFVKAGAIKMAELIVGELKAHASPLAAYLE